MLIASRSLGAMMGQDESGANRGAPMQHERQSDLSR